MRTFAVSLLAAAALASGPFRVGAPVTDFRLADLSGKTIGFSDLRGPTTVVAFISVQCPISNAYNSRMNAAFNDYQPKGVKFVFINSNVNESPADIEAHAKRVGFAFPVYKDRDSTVADLFGAQATPETFVIDSGGVIRYHGYIDDAQNEARAKVRGLRNALDAVLAGKEPPVAETKAFGCTIKRPRRTS